MEWDGGSILVGLLLGNSQGSTPFIGVGYSVNVNNKFGTRC